MTDTVVGTADPTFKRFLIQAGLEDVSAILGGFLDSLSAKETVDIYKGELSFSLTMDGHTCVEILLQVRSDDRPRMLSFKSNQTSYTEILLVRRHVGNSSTGSRIVSLIETFIAEQSGRFSDLELESIIETMPLLMEFSGAESKAFDSFALIWRDHFLEENVALLEAFERAGIQANWILALAKGDATPKRHRITEQFRSKGYLTGVLDNVILSDEQIARRELAEFIPLIEGFVEDARRSGLRVMLIDDGAIVPKCFSTKQGLFDLALELTVPGVKRLLSLPHLDMPVYDLANSRLKQTVTYPEIAESCITRIRELLGAEKFIGRPVTVLGYGSAGRHVARILRNIGCRVAVVDRQMIRLIEAAECGFATFRSTNTALRETKPFLVVGCAGDVSLEAADIECLPDGCYVTGIATRDLAELKNHNTRFSFRQIPYFGTEHENIEGKHFFQLGDGRSINLFESEAIPNRANDVFKAGILVAARDLCTRSPRLSKGIYVAEVDEAIERSGLLERYYDLYLQNHSA